MTYLLRQSDRTRLEYVLSPSYVGLRHGRPALSAAVRTFALTRNAATFKVKVPAVKAVFALASSLAKLKGPPRTLAVVKGTFAMTASTALPTVHRHKLAAVTGHFTYSRKTVAFPRSRKMQVAVRAFLIWRRTASLSVS